MDNANQSAYPTAVPDVPEAHVGGLTKREELAARNYAALLSSGGNVEPELGAYAKIAVKGADALLTELEE